MATRFGASKPNYNTASRVKVLIGLLFTFVFVLVGVLVFMVKDSENVSEPVVNTAVASSPVTAMIPILVAAQRIEGGSRLQPHMFTVQDVRPELVPEGAINARERSTVVGKFARIMIGANLPIIKDSIVTEPPIAAVTSHIPPGYRAVTISVDARSGVEGWAMAGTRVDVLWTYTDRSGNRKVGTIVYFSKILSVSGVTAAGAGAKGGGKRAPGGTTVTLLVTEVDAKKIELARTTGALSLSLVGDNETGSAGSNREPIDITDLLPSSNSGEEEHVPDGVMYSTDPKTGRQIKYELVGGRWKRAS